MGEEEKEKTVTVGKGIVKLSFNVYKTIIASMTRYSNSRIPVDDWIEAMGLLYGYNDGDDVIVTECVPFTHTRKAGHILKVQFDQEDYILASEIENDFLTMDPPQFIVGWVHSHPGIRIMMSQDDVKNHLGWQTNNPNAIALVFNHQRLLQQAEMPKRKGDPIIPLNLDTGFKIFRLADATRGLESNYNEIKFQFIDNELDQTLINNAKEFCLWIGKALPRDNAVLTEYREYISKSIKKLDELLEGTRSYIETLRQKGEQHRISDIMDQQIAKAESLLTQGSKTVNIFRMMPSFLEYKERESMVPEINSILAEWDEKSGKYLALLELMK